MRAKPEEIVSVLREEIQNYDTRVRRDETGTVLEVGDGIATVSGLDRAVYGELVEFETGVQGMVMDLSRNSVGCVLLGQEAGLRDILTVRQMLTWESIDLLWMHGETRQLRMPV